jgi:hypothetical protein
MTYGWFSPQEFLQKPVPFEEKFNKAVLFVSNCEATERAKYVEALIAAMPGQIDSFGGCWKNKQEHTIPGCGGDKYAIKTCILSRNKYVSLVYF